MHEHFTTVSSCQNKENNEILRVGLQRLTEGERDLAAA